MRIVCVSLRRSLLLLATTALALLLLSLKSVEAWGKEGHEIVANIAYQRLSTKAQSIINGIVQYDDWHYHESKNSNKEDSRELSPLGKIANWADQVRLYYKWSSKLHFVDIRDDEVKGGCHPLLRNDECVFSYERDCVDDGCAVGAIVNYTKQMTTYYRQQEDENAQKQQHAIRGGQAHHSNSNNTMHLLLTSLKFLTHFMGDIHQPLHVSRTSDRGGNSIGVKILHNHHHKSHPPPLKMYSYPTVDRYGNANDDHHHYSHNLHSIWDTTIIEYAIHKYFNDSQTLFQKSIATQLDDDNNDDFSSSLKCMNAHDSKCVSLWAEESWLYAMQYAYANLDGAEIVDGTELKEEYLDDRLKIVKKQLGIAGVRLANVLEMALNVTKYGEKDNDKDSIGEVGEAPHGHMRGSFATGEKSSNIFDKFTLDTVLGLVLV